MQTSGGLLFQGHRIMEQVPKDTQLPATRVTARTREVCGETPVSAADGLGSLYEMNSLHRVGQKSGSAVQWHTTQ